jgi:hypothetical protein
MNEHEIRLEIHKVLDSHADLLGAIRQANHAMKEAFEAHDAALVSAIEANRAALRLLNRLINEGIKDQDAP